MYALIREEKKRQFEGLELIASENFTSRAVIECLGSCLTNKYAEGLPGRRYYGGNEVIDKIENLCRDRALKAYGLTPNVWAVNVQPYSGSPANFAVYTALLKPHDRIMGLDLPSGGHLTHGFYTTDKSSGGMKPISATSVYFESFPYSVDPETGLIDYENLERIAHIYKPKMIVCGGSAYPREWDYAKFRQVANSVGALLLCDMAHISGLVATKNAKSPFEFCDVVTTTTHKSLRGPRAGMIFSKVEHSSKIDMAVFPALQGGPHEHQIAGIATQLKEVMTPEFDAYAKQVIANSRALAARLVERGYKLATGGSDNHLILWDLRPEGVTGSKVELVCDAAHITLNKNAVPGDKSALSPGGVRVGTPALTSRGFKEADFEKVGDLLDRAVKIAVNIQSQTGKALKLFRPGVETSKDVAELKRDVHEMASAFGMPGFLG